MHGRRGDMEVEAGRAQAGMTQQELDTTEVHPGFQEMGGKGMPERMGMDGLGQLGGGARLVADVGDAHPCDRFGDAEPGKEPRLELIELPVAP